MNTILLLVVLSVVLLVAVLWTLWQLRVIMPIMLACTRIQALKKYREGYWAGEGTARYVRKTKYGGLWWGYNSNTHSEFVIFNGKIGFESFQIQNWRPRIAFWGGQLFKGQRPVRYWAPVDPAEIAKFRWPSGTKAQLKVYPEFHPQRKPAEAYFANQVRKDIQDVRRGNTVNLWLLIESLKNLTDRRHTSGFHTWLWAIEGVLGADTCRAIGKAVCEQEHFTVEEGERIQQERSTRHKSYNCA